jgi:predicted DNA-binding transcriptional regulator YafY
LQIILDFLKEQAFMRASFAQIQEHLNQLLPTLGLKAISRRSLEADLQVLKTNATEKLLHVRVSKKHYYQLIAEPQSAVSEALQVSMLQQIAQQLGAKFQEPNLKLQDKLVFSLSALNDDGQSLQMAATCLQAIEQQYLLQFLYQSAFGTYKSRLQVVAPLQVRFYEGRFYLVACEWSERQKAPKQQIKVFAFDLIENYVAVPALAEREDGSEGELQYFSWQQMAQEVELKTHFKHCLGIARFKESIPELIRLKFTDWAISYVKSRRLHSSQRIVVDNPNYIVVELYIYRTYELSMLLSRFRDFGSEVR